VGRVAKARKCLHKHALDCWPLPTTIRRVTDVAQPVVLVAEELSLAGIALLEADFEVRYVDGSARAALLPA